MNIYRKEPPFLVVSAASESCPAGFEFGWWYVEVIVESLTTPPQLSAQTGFSGQPSQSTSSSCHHYHCQWSGCWMLSSDL